jgi:hypothetical protein
LQKGQLKWVSRWRITLPPPCWLPLRLPIRPEDVVEGTRLLDAQRAIAETLARVEVIGEPIVDKAADELLDLQRAMRMPAAAAYFMMPGCA